MKAAVRFGTEQISKRYRASAVCFDFAAFTHADRLIVDDRRRVVVSRCGGRLDRCGNVLVPLSQEDWVREVSSAFDICAVGLADVNAQN